FRSGDPSPWCLRWARGTTPGWPTRGAGSRRGAASPIRGTAPIRRSGTPDLAPPRLALLRARERLALPLARSARVATPPPLVSLSALFVPRHRLSALPVGRTGRRIPSLTSSPTSPSSRRRERVDLALEIARVARPGHGRGHRPDGELAADPGQDETLDAGV